LICGVLTVFNIGGWFLVIVAGFIGYLLFEAEK